MCSCDECLDSKERRKPKLIDVKYKPVKDGFDCIETYSRWVPSASVDVRHKLKEHGVVISLEEKQDDRTVSKTETGLSTKREG